MWDCSSATKLTILCTDRIAGNAFSGETETGCDGHFACSSLCTFKVNYNLQDVEHAEHEFFRMTEPSEPRSQCEAFSSAPTHGKIQASRRNLHISTSVHFFLLFKFYDNRCARK